MFKLAAAAVTVTRLHCMAMFDRTFVRGVRRRRCMRSSVAVADVTPRLAPSIGKPGAETWCWLW